jgi:hypothetical protein
MMAVTVVGLSEVIESKQKTLLRKLNCLRAGGVEVVDGEAEERSVKQFRDEIIPRTRPGDLESPGSCCELAPRSL